MGVNAMINGGLLIPPTFLKRTEEEAREIGKRVIKKETSDKVRYMMRLNAETGSARQAEARAKGYYLGGKTGTAEKVVNGRYSKKQVLNSFTAVLPMDNPQFQVLVMLDEPKALPETHGFITSGWNAVPTGGNVIARIAPLLGLEPRFDLAPSDRLILATSKVTQ
jgi:cell division protein FtsI (penicillin-binding protein 3)